VALGINGARLWLGVVDILEEGILGRKGRVEAWERRGRSFGCEERETGDLNIKLLVSVAMSGV